MKYLAASKRFQNQIKKLPPHEQQKALETLKKFFAVLKSGGIPQGYGFKKINGDKYEIRVDIRTRIIMKSEGDILICHLIGSHDEVRRFMREFRNR